MGSSNDEVIVAGVDGTELSERAAAWAARQAVVFGKPLLLVHAMRWPVYAQTAVHMPVGAIQPGVNEEPVRQWAQGMLDAMAERCRTSTAVEVRTEIVPGDPADAVVLAEDRVAFVVVGHSDRGGVARFLIGSTAERLARSCPWPVVVLRDQATAGRRRDRGSVVVGVDGSAVSGEAVRFAFEFAARHGAEVTIVHAASGEITTAAEPVETVEEAALRERRGPVGAQLAECVRQHPAISHRLETRGGPPAEALLAASTDADLLVVGSHGKGAVRRAFLGSVSREVVDRAECPVAVLPPETTATST